MHDFNLRTPHKIGSLIRLEKVITVISGLS